jgi:Asp/Glu/hydantoin racemase
LNNFENKGYFQMNLCIDIGNSQVKTAVYSGTRITVLVLDHETAIPVENLYESKDHSRERPSCGELQEPTIIIREEPFWLLMQVQPLHMI